jgi:tetratricopeptide (TPR) repeat protein
VNVFVELGARRVDVDGATAPPGVRALEPELVDLLAEARGTHGLSDDVLLRTWASRGLLESDRDRRCLRLRPGTDLAEALPPDAHTLALRRIGAALQQCPDPRAATDALALVALAGSAPPTLLLRSLEDGGVDALIASGLVVPEDGTLCFEHPDVEAAARDMAEARADVPQAHRRLADAWTGYARRTGVDVRPQLGLHLLRAGSPAEALHPLLWSLRALLEGGRAREALRTAALAVEAADATGHLSSAITARRLHAEALVEMGDTERAMALARFALAQAAQIADTSSALLLRVLLARAQRKSGAVDAAQRELDAVADLCAPGTPVDRAQLAQRARTLRARGEHLAAARAWQAILPPTLLGGTGNPARAGTAGAHTQDPSAVAEAMCGYVESLLRGGEFDTADRYLTVMSDCAESTDDLRRGPEALGVLAMRELLVGDSARAARLLHEAVRRACACGFESLTLRLRLALASAARRAGMTGVAWTAATDALRTAQVRGHTLAAATARLERALAAHADEHPERVVAETDAAAEALSHAPRHALWLYVSVLRAVCSAGERAFETRWTIARARGLPESGAPVDLHPALAWLEGRLRALGDDETADAVATARATPRAPEILGLLGGA